MQEQITLMEWLAQNQEHVQEATVEIKDVVNIKARPVCDFEVFSTYRDIFIIINMLDDYVRLLERQEHRGPRTDYMIAQFKRISASLAEQIQFDKEKMYRKCIKKQTEDEGVGEDAFIQISRRANQRKKEAEE